MTETHVWNLRVTITSEAGGDADSAADAVQTLLSDNWFEWLAEAMGIEDSYGDSSICVTALV